MRYFQWWSGNSMIQPNLWTHALTPDHPKTDQWWSVEMIPEQTRRRHD